MIEQVYVPSLMLQPFIENAIWHGLSLKKGKKKINITIKKENENHVTISVRDNGVGREYSMNKNKNKSTSEESVGLKLTEERLTHFSKKFTYSYSIIFCDHKDNQNQSLGTEVIIQIPIK